jgi:REP element-mobilizing transposase RayT
MKWRNFYPDNHCFFITSTVNSRIPLLSQTDIANIFISHVSKAKTILDFKLYAYVIMPDHWHLLLYFDNGPDCLAFNRDFKRFSSTDVIRHLRQVGRIDLLNVFHSHANGKTKYSLWKEQARVIPIFSSKKLEKKLEYIHLNPVKRGLVDSPGVYLYSSANFYITGQKGPLEVDRIETILFT